MTDNSSLLQRIEAVICELHAVRDELRATPRGENVLRALLATGLTGPQALRLAPWVAPDRLETIINEVDFLMPNVTPAWLGEMLALSADDRERHRLFHIWPAGWAEEQVRERSRERDVMRRKLQRQNNTTSRSGPAEYSSLVKLRPRVVLALIPEERPISVAELTTKTARRREFVDANGKPLSAETRHRVLHRALDVLLAQKLIVDDPEYLPNGRPIRRVARMRT